MQCETGISVEAETLVARIEAMLLMDDISEEQKIEILRKLVSIADKNSLTKID